MGITAERRKCTLITAKHSPPPHSGFHEPDDDSEDNKAILTDEQIEAAFNSFPAARARWCCDDDDISDNKVTVLDAVSAVASALCCHR